MAGVLLCGLGDTREVSDQADECQHFALGRSFCQERLNGWRWAAARGTAVQRKVEGTVLRSTEAAREPRGR